LYFAPPSKKTGPFFAIQTPPIFEHLIAVAAGGDRRRRRRRGRRRILLQKVSNSAIVRKSSLAAVILSPLTTNSYKPHSVKRYDVTLIKSSLPH